MQRKYEFVDGDTITLENGTILKRIRAVITIPDHFDAGELGGYIEHEGNLSHHGKAWVSENANVYGKAIVQDDASVSENASVFDNATLSNNAHIGGWAMAFGNARLSDHACAFGWAKIKDRARLFGSCAVFGDSRVYRNAFICGNASISGNAHVKGDAEIGGSAIITGYATILGAAKISGDPFITDNAVIYGDAEIECNPRIYGNANIGNKDMIFIAIKSCAENSTMAVYKDFNDQIIVTSWKQLDPFSVEKYLAFAKNTNNKMIENRVKSLIEIAQANFDYYLNTHKASESLEREMTEKFRFKKYSIGPMPVIVDFFN